ncbi:hypothetical protein ABK864_25275, partial [Serratia marcescens]|uniref:hypothetical protein n=1 Tax=Serratia marcescens TaxID=615 RepID=UPI00374EB7D5
PMPNSEVKRRSADGSVGSPHARVGHCQASNKAESPELTFRAFAMRKINILAVSITLKNTFLAYVAYSYKE